VCGEGARVLPRLKPRPQHCRPQSRDGGRIRFATVPSPRRLAVRVTVTPDQIQSAFEAVKDDPSFDESRGLWERGHAPVEMLQAMCLRPEILRAFAGFGASVYPGGLLERHIKELVIITASAANECQFCTNAHVDIVDIWNIVETPLAIIDEPARLPPRGRPGAQRAI